MAEKKTGTKEWAEVSMNIQMGCEHLCRYCYGAYNMVHRYKKCSQKEWENPTINQKKVDLPHKRKYDGRVMFPTQHDITPANINESIIIIKKLLDAANDVLIVSKPQWECITLLCESLTKHKEHIMFRFTIGSAHNNVLEFWEPNAPNLTERLCCLQYAHAAGYKTSVSCEPMLDIWPAHVYAACEEYLTDSIWFGKLRNFNGRVDTSKITTEEMDKYVLPLRASQQDGVIRQLVKLMEGWEYVKWKDSIIEVIEKAR